MPKRVEFLTLLLPFLFHPRPCGGSSKTNQAKNGLFRSARQRRQWHLCNACGNEWVVSGHGKTTTFLAVRPSQHLGPGRHVANLERPIDLLLYSVLQAPVHEEPPWRKARR